MKEGIARQPVSRLDYSPYPWGIEALKLHFDIRQTHTIVSAEMDFSHHSSLSKGGEILLDGQNLELTRVAIDGRDLEPEEYSVDKDRLLIHSAPARCQISTVVNIRPQENTALEGLYPSGEFLLTQCEAEGFRKITYFPDRPDVMTRFEVTVLADRHHYPVLLSNGNPVDFGEMEDGRHWVRWLDPHRKPCYLFALVAGHLAHIEDHFVTRSGRDVTLRVYVEKQNLDKCDYAMESLIKSMRWDEDRFGLEYDLDIYNIVATDDFNMGAMENKSLNIFNSKYVLARPDTATDADYEGIEGVIGHEYFHNWTGNRVTCRDWFQLTLKEGLTVFRDQEFTSDMQSRAVKRIQDVRELRSRQFPEDSGPMAHPIRPDQYIEINNFYTMTVYQKGATIVRMLHTLLGEQGFQSGMRLYFKRHDGQAVTCDDFLAAMAAANDIDLDGFGKWYGQSGTPEVTARTEYDPSAKRFTLVLAQHTPATRDQTSKQALLIPFAMGLLTPEGQQIPIQLAGEPSPSGFTRLLLLQSDQQTFVFENVPCSPIPALLRDFSAPVKLRQERTASELAILMKHDPDAFVRWEAAQQLAQEAILHNCRRLSESKEMQLPSSLSEAYGSLLTDKESDPALLAEAMSLPGELYLSEQLDIIDVDGIHAARRFVKSALGATLRDHFRSVYDALNRPVAYENSAPSVARRSLKNLCLSYLVENGDDTALAERQLASSDNMTDTLAALGALVWVGAGSADAVLEEFETKWKHDSLVLDKWFAMQATQPGGETVERVEALLAHPAFSVTNPNKVRALIGAFAMSNPTGFHAISGEGYRFVADRVIELDHLNPQVSARLAGAFNNWKRYDSQRQDMMQSELKRIAAESSLSPDVSEIVGNALAG